MYYDSRDKTWYSSDHVGMSINASSSTGYIYSDNHSYGIGIDWFALFDCYVYFDVFPNDGTTKQVGHTV